MGLVSTLAQLFNTASHREGDPLPPSLPPSLRVAARMLANAQPSLPAEQRAALARETIALLAAIDPALRVQHARDMGLPRHASRLGDEAHALLAFFMDDDVLRPQLGELAIEVWLAIDRATCSAYALSRSDAWTREMLVALCIGVDPAEAYDALADRFRRDPQLRAHLGSATWGFAGLMRPALQDPRFVELALEFVAREQVTMMHFLIAQGSPRAIEELGGVLERAEQFQDVSGLIDRVRWALRSEEFVALLARLLRGGAGEPVDMAAARWLQHEIRTHNDALEVLLANDARALARVKACGGPYPPTGPVVPPQVWG
jgi:hypothetical protein